MAQNKCIHIFNVISHIYDELYSFQQFLNGTFQDEDKNLSDEQLKLTQKSVCYPCRGPSVRKIFISCSS